MITDPNFIIKTVASYHNISVDKMLSHDNSKTLFAARLLTMKLLRNVLHMTYSSIAEYMDRDHMAIKKALERNRKRDYRFVEVLYERFKEAIESTPIYLTEV